jgi:hypothetical protein
MDGAGSEDGHDVLDGWCSNVSGERVVVGERSGRGIQDEHGGSDDG